MPGPLLDTPPFRRDRDPALQRLAETLVSTLEPDAAELEFVFLPDGLRFRRPLLGPRPGAARPARKDRRDGLPDTRLEVPFSVPGLVSGRLILERRGRRVFTGAERMRFSLLAPLLTQLLELAASCEANGGARRRLTAAVERTEEPVLLLDAGGTILFANEAADALLSRQTEEGLAVLADDRGTVPLLGCLLRLAGLEAPPAHERLALTNGRSLDVRFASIADGEADGGARVVTLHELSPLTHDDVLPLLHARGVSEREAEVVGLVLQGHRNAEIAGALFISEYTVKDHLKHVFVKLGVRSRGGLIRALYESPESLAGGARPSASPVPAA